MIDFLFLGIMSGAAAIGFVCGWVIKSIEGRDK